MNKHEMLKLPVEVISQIDKVRGRMSRSDFLRRLIRDHNNAPYQTQAYVTEEEFHEFQQGTKELLRSFLDFVVTFGLELGVGPGKTPGLNLAQFQQSDRVNGRHPKGHNGKDSATDN